MNKKFNKSELNVVRHSKSYRYLSIVCIAVNAVGIIYAVYILLFPEFTYESRHINIIRLNAMVIMLGMSCLMYTCIRTIEKYKLQYDTEQDVSKKED
jgi:amino acid permease